MAQGDVKSGVKTIAVGTSSVVDIKPASGEEWVIHNLYYSAGIAMQMTDGTNIIEFDSDTNSGARLGAVFHLTNSYWLRIRNTSASSTVLVSYDGIQTK